MTSHGIEDLSGVFFLTNYLNLGNINYLCEEKSIW